jgi:hypothetical protein
MTWVQFGHAEPPAPSLELQTRRGDSLQIADFRGRSNLIVLFLHAWDCETCRGVMQQFSSRAGELDARLLAVVPGRSQAPPQALPGLRVLIDADRRLAAEFASLLEFELPGELMMYVLDAYNTPVRAWVGAESDEIDLFKKASEALDYITIQCPE